MPVFVDRYKVKKKIKSTWTLNVSIHTPPSVGGVTEASNSSVLPVPWMVNDSMSILNEQTSRRITNLDWLKIPFRKFKITIAAFVYGVGHLARVGRVVGVGKARISYVGAILGDLTTGGWHHENAAHAESLWIETREWGPSVKLFALPWSGNWRFFTLRRNYQLRSRSWRCIQIGWSRCRCGRCCPKSCGKRVWKG